MTKPGIVAVLEHYGFSGLIDYGGWHATRCVFHGDRHASASYNPDEEVFKCHVCDIAGDAYTVIQSQEGGDFGSAKRRAEEITGVAHSEVPGRAKPVKSKLSERQRARGRGNRALSARRGGRD